MNEKQKRILIIVAVVVVVMLLFPPFHLQAGKATVGVGYHFIFSQPKYLGTGGVGTVNVLQLMAQWFGVVVVGGIAALLVKE